VILDEILPRWGVETVFVDGSDLDHWREALSLPAAAVFFESPSNPMQEFVDIAAVCDLAHGAGAKVVVDNVFGTPVFSKPLELGLTSSCIRRPNTLTARAGRWVGPSWGLPISFRDRSRT
jgi:cystathionine beta-lyase/cystathionine gamma-synthase